MCCLRMSCRNTSSFSFVDDDGFVILFVCVCFFCFFLFVYACSLAFFLSQCVSPSMHAYVVCVTICMFMNTIVYIVIFIVISINHYYHHFHHICTIASINNICIIKYSHYSSSLLYITLFCWDSSQLLQ